MSVKINTQRGMFVVVGSSLLLANLMSCRLASQMNSGGQTGAMASNGITVNFPSGQTATGLALGDSSVSSSSLALDTTALPPATALPSTNLKVSCVSSAPVVAVQPAPVASPAAVPASAPAPVASPAPAATPAASLADGRGGFGGQGFNQGGQGYGRGGFGQQNGNYQQNSSWFAQRPGPRGMGHFGHRQGGGQGQPGSGQALGQQVPGGAPQGSGQSFVVNLKDSTGNVVQSVTTPITCPSMAITLPGIADGSYDIVASVLDSQNNPLYQGDTGSFAMASGAFQAAVVLNMNPVSGTAAANAIVVNFPSSLGQVGAASCDPFRSRGHAQTSSAPASCQMAVSLSIIDAGSSQPISSGTVNLYAADPMGPQPSQGTYDPMSKMFRGLTASPVAAAAPLASISIASGSASLGSLSYGLYRADVVVSGYITQHVMIPVLPRQSATRQVSLKAVPSTASSDQAACTAANHVYNSNSYTCNANATLVSSCNVAAIQNAINASQRLTASDKTQALAWITQYPAQLDGSTNFSFVDCYTNQMGFMAELKAVNSSNAIQKARVFVPK